MGRIDEALRRKNVDVSGGTGAPAPSASPWQFDDGPRDAAAGQAAADMRDAAAATDAADPRDAAASRRPQAAGRNDFPSFPDNPRLVVSSAASPLHVEQFRGLAASLHQAQLQQPIKSVIVTSASPGDGKSHVAVNLALTMSQSYGRRVLLIDADLRRPSLHQALRVRNDRGLSEALNAGEGERVPTVPITATLTLLPAGRPDTNPLAALASDRMKRLVAAAAAQFDWVIVDAPPVGVLADARLVSETVDGAIVVIRAGVTRFPDLEAAADALGHERILGVVLNAVDPPEIRGEDYYRRYYYGADRDAGDLGRPHAGH